LFIAVIMQPQTCYLWLNQLALFTLFRWDYNSQAKNWAYSSNSWTYTMRESPPQSLAYQVELTVEHILLNSASFIKVRYSFFHFFFIRFVFKMASRSIIYYIKQTSRFQSACCTSLVSSACCLNSNNFLFSCTACILCVWFLVIVTLDRN